MSIRQWRHATGWPRVRAHPRLRPRSRGQALVELALILPIILLLLAAALDLGRLFYSRVTVANAAREGAIEAALNPGSFVAGSACDAVANRVMCRIVNETQSSFVTVAPADVALSCSPVSCAPGIGSNVTVTVTGHFSLITPILAIFTGGQDVTFSTSATAQIATTPVVSSGPGPSAGASAAPSASAGPSGSAGPSASASAGPSPFCGAPVANFTWTNPSNKVISFTDTSTNMSNPGCNPVWSWNFGDGAGSSSNQSPTYTYQSGNSRDATLTVSNSGGSSSVTKTVDP